MGWRMSERYRPSSGCEGADFQEEFCSRCRADQAFRDGTGDSCPIIAATMVFDVDDENYPAEWIYGADGKPTCTAFAALTTPDSEA